MTSAKLTFLTGAKADFEVIPINPAEVLGRDWMLLRGFIVLTGTEF